MTFHVGQKVVCVDDTKANVPVALDRMGGLTRGRIYTVRQNGLASWIDGRPCVRLEEIVRPFPDTPYWAHRFRPVIERETSIEVFTAMLTPQPTKREPVA